MSDAGRFQEAEGRWASGDVQGARNIHLDICTNGRDDRVRLESALLLVDRVKPIDHLAEFLHVCDIGIACALKTTAPLPEAYLMGKRAEGLAVLTGVSLVPERKTLRMAPGWFGFSLERDEARFKELTQKVESIDGEVDGLLSRGLAISGSAGSHSTKAQVLLCSGRVHFQRYMNLKMEYLKQRFKVPSFLLGFLRPYRLDEFFLFTKEERANMERCLAQCQASYLAAADEFREDGQESATAYAYYNLANEFRTAFRFRKAKKYLSLAKQIAERNGDNKLLPGIKVLEQSIRVRNRDVPNYLAGERREIPG